MTHNPNDEAIKLKDLAERLGLNSYLQQGKRVIELNVAINVSRDFILQERQRAIQTTLEAVEKIVHTDAVFAVNATPVVGEVFDMEKLNYANQKLNGLTSFILERVEALKAQLLTEEGKNG